MTLEEVRRVLPAVPFQLFGITFAHVSSIQVPPPDFIAVPRTGGTGVVYKDGDRAHTLIDLLLVTNLEMNGTGQSAS